jgi:hypothetical protein
MPVSPDEDRKRGRIEERGPNLRVVVYAGLDPVTGKRAYLRETVKGNDRTARRQANKVMTRLLAEVDKKRATESSVHWDWRRLIRLGSAQAANEAEPSVGNRAWTPRAS